MALVPTVWYFSLVLFGRFCDMRHRRSGVRFGSECLAPNTRGELRGSKRLQVVSFPFSWPLPGKSARLSLGVEHARQGDRR